MLGSLRLDGWAVDVCVSGNLAYVAAAFGGMRVINIGNPAAPVELGNITWSKSNVAGLAVANGRAVIADRKSGVRVLDVSNPAAPRESGYWAAFPFVQSVALSGNYAFIASGFGGIRIYNVSDPAHPLEVSSFQVDGFFFTLKLSGNRLFAGTMTDSPQSGLYVLDISDPAHPAQIGYYNKAMECRGIEVVGNVAYVADGDGLQVFDFSHPPALDRSGFYPLNQTRGVTVRNGLAFVTQQFEGVQILDVSNPANMHIVGAFNANDSFTFGPVGLSGQYAYITEAWGLRVLNVSNLAAPFEVSTTPFLFNENPWLVLDDNRHLVYIAQGSYGFSVYDVSDPAAPALIEKHDVLGSLQMLDLVNSRIVAASGEGGLQIFSETSALTPRQVFTPPQPQNDPDTFYLPPPGHRSEANHLLPADKPLAPERAAGTCTVTSTANAGPGTLRSCLQNQVSGDVITFLPSVFPPSAPATIYIGPEALPHISQGHITIDASNAGVILDGSAISVPWVAGISIYFSDNNVIRGLQVVKFPVGIGISGNNNVIGGSRLTGSGPTGQGNVVSDCTGQAGISIQDGAEGNVILGNIVGLNAAGTQAYPNQGIGISINKVANNTIGSQNAGEDNIVSANLDAGILLYGFSNVGNKIIGNKVGTDITGKINLGNQGVGVYIESGSLNTLLQGNLISGNKSGEVSVWDNETDFNVLIGNFIGTEITGNEPLPKLASSGIVIGFASYTRIGGTGPGEGNVIANPGGLFVAAPFSAQTRIAGNHIGVNATGTASFATDEGILLKDVTRTIVGGTTSEEANYVTASGSYNLKVLSKDNFIAGNFLGLAMDGVTPLASASFHVYSTQGGNIIQNNHVANSTSAGIWLDGAQKNTIRRNSIWANPFKGIFLDHAANANLPAPTIILNSTGGGGSTCPGCVVELFVDEGNQGRYYLDSLNADTSGDFTFPPYCPLSADKMTATATDRTGNTSEFSAAQVIPWSCSGARPAPILTNLSPSSRPVFAPTFQLTLSGANFTTDSIVRWGSIALPTTIFSSTQALAVVPSYLFQQGGEFPVTIFTPAPGGGVSGSRMVTVTVPERIYLPVTLK
jgi:parallel beta-helix repeat protein